MTQQRPFFSVCIPAYNRAHHLRPLLDSILAQDFNSYEILICEDKSRERTQIAAVANDYDARFPGRFVYHENEVNLGYDANIRNLVARARGEYCFFMGNDDIMCPGALRHVHDLIARHPAVGMVLKSYAWFDHAPDVINQEVRYFSEERFFAAGRDAITVCFRRAGVISGYVIHRDPANKAATDEFDGTLYYQMHMTASVLTEENAVATPMVLVLCRNSEPPEFGNSSAEKGKYTPGHYTPEARLRMIGGALSIAKALDKKKNTRMMSVITKDYANYFYPYIKDQLNISPGQYMSLYVRFAKMGFWKYPLFHVYFVLGYALGERRFDAMTKYVRTRLGRSPQFGIK